MSQNDPRVMIVDDVEVNVVLLQRMLATFGITAVAGTSDSQQAVELVRTFDADLALFDLHMPGMTGLDVLTALHGTSSEDDYRPVIVLTADDSSTAKRTALSIGAHDFVSNRLPIIAMTAAAMPTDQERCLAAGMDDYVSKPTRADDLAAVLARWIATAPADGACAAPPAGEDRPLPEVLEPQRLRELRGLVQDGGIDLYLDLAELFLEHLAEGVAALHEAVARGDAPAVERQAHALMGAAGNLGAEALAGVVGEFEQLGRSGMTVGTELLTRLDTEQRRYREAVEALRKEPASPSSAPRA